MKKPLFIVLSSLCLYGCFPFDDGEESEIVDRYYVRRDSRLTSVHIGYVDGQYGGIGLIGEPVTAVGHNENYIIAKTGVDNSLFYILKVIRNGVYSDAEKAIIGPLDKEIFDEKLKQLGLEKSLKFDEDYKIE